MTEPTEVTKGKDPAAQPGTHSVAVSEASRPVFIIHYVTEKPWTTIRAFVSGKIEKMWPDTKQWYEAEMAMVAYAKEALAAAHDDTPGAPAETKGGTWPGTSLPKLELTDSDFDLVIQRLQPSACFMSQQEADAIYASESRPGRKARQAAGKGPGPSAPNARKRREPSRFESLSFGPASPGGQSITLLPPGG